MHLTIAPNYVNKIPTLGYLTGYNGTFPFDKPGDLYLDHNYEGMRLVRNFKNVFPISVSTKTFF